MQGIDKGENLNQSAPIDTPLSIGEITTVLIKHYGLNEGYFDLSIEFNIGIGAVGPNPDALLPGGMFGVSRIGLVRSKNAGPLSIDAAKVNPKKRQTKRTSK